MDFSETIAACDLQVSLLFEQTMMGRSLRCYLPSLVEICPLVLVKFFKGLSYGIYGLGGHPGPVTSIILKNFDILKYLHYLNVCICIVY